MAPSAGFAPFRKTRFPDARRPRPAPSGRERPGPPPPQSLALSGLGRAGCPRASATRVPSSPSRILSPFPGLAFPNQTNPPIPATSGWVCVSCNEKMTDRARCPKPGRRIAWPRPEERREGDKAKGCVQVAVSEALPNNPEGPKRLGQWSHSWEGG